MTDPRQHQAGQLRRLGASAFGFVLTMGVVNLFADMTYEGGASLNGPFLASLGLSVAGISVLAGVGEAIGYGLRSVSGWVADRTGRLWLVTAVGYCVNLLAVPAMALTQGWEAAAALILAERAGRAIRKPTVDEMLSYAAHEHGRGWIYALNNALDETGALLGPIVVALALSHGLDARGGFWVLGISAVMALAALLGARVAFPTPAKLEKEPGAGADQRFTRRYALAMIGGSLFAAGILSYELVSLDLVGALGVREETAPLWLAFATAGSIAASLVIGRLYDRHGVLVVAVAIVLSSAFAPLFFVVGGPIALGALLLLGVAYATQDALFKALLAGVVPAGRRSFGFGAFYLGYGGGWVVGSTIMGLLHGASPGGLAAFSAVVQIASIPFFWLAGRGAPAPEAT
jgi:MFS family permease